jgi:hypothetical protein
MQDMLQTYTLKDSSFQPVAFNFDCLSTTAFKQAITQPAFHTNKQAFIFLGKV